MADTDETAAPGASGVPEVKSLYTADAIAEKVELLAGEIAESRPQNLLAIIVLKGGFVFAADLVRALSGHGVRMEIEFIALSSYGSGRRSSGEVRILRDIGCEVSGRDVLIIDDVLDSGLTLRFARDLMLDRNARRVRVAVLIDKPHGRSIPFEG